jgi:hypothetical protein
MAKGRQEGSKQRKAWPQQPAEDEVPVPAQTGGAPTTRHADPVGDGPPR